MWVNLLALPDQKVTVVFSSIQGVMLVFDVTNERSFDNIKQWLKTIDTVASYVASYVATYINVMRTYVTNYCICSLP